jgi:hypothetical protein
MALTWINAKSNWRLVWAGFVVGHVLHCANGPQAGRFVWSITWPHASKVLMDTHGDTADVEAAKAALVAAWRNWQTWATIRDAD